MDNQNMTQHMYTVPALLTCLRHWLCLLMAGVLHVFCAGFCAVLSTVSLVQKLCVFCKE